MNKKRSANESKVEILKACREPLCITHIMYRVNSWHGRIKKDLQYLIDKKLLRKVERENKVHPLYQTTLDGKAVIKEYDEYISALNDCPKGLS